MTSDPLSEKTRRPSFEVHPVNNGGFVIDDGGRTVALVTRRGYVDWLRRSPQEAGECIRHLPKDTHTSYVRGFKFNLHVPYLTDASGRAGTKLFAIEHRVEEGGARVTLSGRGRRADGRFESLTEATMSLSPDGLRYEWKLRTTITHLGDKAHTLNEIEYNNLYPSRAYRGILHQGEKEFTRTLFEDEEGTVWDFPHQHAFHYGKKISTLRFGRSSWAGFFDSPEGCPVITVTESALPLHWPICDMYYDLHCAARAPYEFQPHETITFVYAIGYLDADEAKTWAQGARRIGVTEAEWAGHTSARFDFGLNSFESAVQIDSVDDACFYRPSPPERVWDREAGPTGKGSLRLTSEGETVVWTSEPPFHAINGTTLRIAGRVRTEAVSGRGFFFRLHYYHYVWEPAPGFEPIRTIESEAITGTLADWRTITLPPMEIPPGPVEDGMLRLELVLEGSGIAWATDIDVGIADEPEDQQTTEAAALPSPAYTLT